MKKRFIIPTALVGIIGGYGIAQATIFSSAENITVLTANEAKTIALKEFDGDIIEFEYDNDDRAPHYEFEIKNDKEKVEIVVDAQSGAVLVTERETIQAAQNPVSAVAEKVEKQVDEVVANAQVAIQPAVPKEQVTTSEAIISKAEAIAIAQQQVNGTVIKVELDDDNEYEIEIKDGNTEYEFEIDAMTGTITSFEEDN